MSSESRVSYDDVLAGQAPYTPLTLAAYDLWVTHLSNRLFWQCPNAEILALFERNVSANHLDVGVGSGFYLARAHWPVERPRLVLMDLNENSLAHAARRVAHLQPETLRANVLDPLPDIAPFDSVSLNYLLHCLPGTMASKAVVFENLKAVLNPGGVVFGSTILHKGVERNPLARGVMALYNRRRFFTNTADDLRTLEAALHENFADVELRVRGCVGLFAAR